jgi:hypothetical protein
MPILNIANSFYSNVVDAASTALIYVCVDRKNLDIAVQSDFFKSWYVIQLEIANLFLNLGIAVEIANLTQIIAKIKILSKN